MKASYTVDVTARDPSGLSATVMVTVTVTDVDDMGMVTLSAMQPTVGVALTAMLSDDDMAMEHMATVMWQWASSGAMDGTYTDIIEDATSASYTPVDGDANMYLRATAMYTDGYGPGKSASAESANMVVGLLISGMSNVVYAENGAEMVATYSASGADAASAAWTLEGDDAGDFAISSDGVLTFVSSPDYENAADAGMDNTYMVTVMAADGTYMATREVVVTVTDVAEDTTPVIGDAVLDRWDDDESGKIEGTEVLAAVRAYFAGDLSSSDVLEVVRRYLADARSSS